MPYKDPEAQRAYQREWMRRQRALYLAGKGCVDCGSTTDLELDHQDKSQKVSHRVWSWSRKRRDAELAKCVVRCDSCHNERHASEKRQEHGLGAYKNRGCRCDICKAAKAAAQRRYIERRRRDLHPGTRICSPLLSSSATSPAEQPTLFDLEEAA